MALGRALPRAQGNPCAGGFKVITLGTTEIWQIRNQTGSFHNFHVHDIQFKVLRYGGTAPPPNLAGWKTPWRCHPARACGL
jgi:hypothetical protein